jgi:hypothetical protein
MKNVSLDGTYSHHHACVPNPLGRDEEELLECDLRCTTLLLF